MGFLFRCPHCKAESEVDEKFAGEQGPCFSCGKLIRLPAPQSTSLEQAQEMLKHRGRFDHRRFWGAAIMTVALIAVLGGIWGLSTRVLIPLIENKPARLKLVDSRENLEKIAEAMRLYEQDFGSLPPAYVVDANGKPSHSWRVLILPYLGETALYNRYSFDEPWNGEHNRTLLERMPSVFKSPFDIGSVGLGETSYMVVVGQSTLFPGASSRSLNAIADGPADTIVVAEVHDSRVNWMEPIDLSTSQMRFTINGGRQEISSGYKYGAPVVTADGQSHVLPFTAAPPAVEALTSANGGEAIFMSEIREDDDSR